MADDLLGYGLLRPFRRDQKQDFANSGGAELVISSVEQILGTERNSGAQAGEVPWDDELGSRLHLLRHKNATPTNQELARVYTAEAFQQEPRAKLRSVVLEERQRDKGVELRVRVGFDAITKNAAGNEVIVRGLEVDLPV